MKQRSAHPLSIGLLVLISFCVASCGTSSDGEFIRDLDDQHVYSYKFEELPPCVTLTLDSNIEVIVKTDSDLWYSCDSNSTFYYGSSWAGDSWVSEVSSNYHHFFVNGVHFRLRGNKGDPFILCDGRLFYCDYNLYVSDYRSRTYYSVVLPNVLDEKP